MTDWRPPTFDTPWSPPVGAPEQAPSPAPSAPVRQRPTARRRLLATATVIALAGGAGFAGGQLASHSTTVVQPIVPAQSSSVNVAGDRLSVAAILAKVEPSVVSIETTVTARRGPYTQTGQGAGSGLVLSTNGEVLTNAHVVEGASSITVKLPGDAVGRRATLIGADPANDLALLKIAPAADLVAAPLGDSDEVKVGDDVVAIGNALALEGGPTVTRGIVSAVDRSIDTAQGSLSGLLQTDASISSGNSGGPLVNAAGQVIGINTAVAASGGGTSAENIGFVIPISTALPIVEQLRS